MKLKQVVLTLIGAFTVTASSYATEPLGFGVKMGIVNNNLTNAEKGLANHDAKFLNPALLGSLYGEYAFHEMVGVELEAGYMGLGLAKVANVATKTDGDKNFTSLEAQFIKASLGVKVYPMGREDKEDSGILSVRVAADFYLPMAAKVNEKAAGTEARKDQDVKEKLAAYGIGAGLVVGYELPFGLIAEFNGGYVFTDFFKDDVSRIVVTKSTEATVKNNLWNAGLSVGYNLATLLEA